ncbi:unnamed protein product [Echinostoma caproni]|uniref:Uncharacterized protein n=1 Tax=Echinostoma caproni TaxID=27848 RepID=A0A183AN38_9TREM|nr:unnamed protein product [Echinostoma caproni]
MTKSVYTTEHGTLLSQNSPTWKPVSLGNGPNMIFAASVEASTDNTTVNMSTAEVPAISTSIAIVATGTEAAAATATTAPSTTAITTAMTPTMSIVAGLVSDCYKSDSLVPPTTTFLPDANHISTPDTTTAVADKVGPTSTCEDDKSVGLKPNTIARMQSKECNITNVFVNGKSVVIETTKHVS